MWALHERGGVVVRKGIMMKRTGLLVVAVVALGLGGRVASAQQPVFEDALNDDSQITGQWGSGVFTASGYVLTQSGGTDANGNPKSVDFVWYDLPGVGSDGSGSIEFDVTGLYPNDGCVKNELMVSCDSTGINPATTGGDYYSSTYRLIMRKDNGTTGNVNKMKIAASAGATEFESRTNVLSWNGTTTYRFRVTWGGNQMRAYRGLPGQALTLLSPPTPYNFGAPWAPTTLHVQIGSTFRAGPRGISESGGTPGAVYSCLRVYEEDLGGAATPLCGEEPPPPESLSVDLGLADLAEGITHPQSADGDTTAATIDDRNCRRNLDPGATPADNYFYFAVDDLYAFEGNRPEVYVTLDYYDTGTGDLELHYDSSDFGGAMAGAYKSGGTIALTGADTWMQHTFHLTDAYFGNRQNADADFRVFGGGGGHTFYLDVVHISDTPPPGLPGKATSPDPPYQATDVGRTACLSWEAGQDATAHDVYFGTSNPLPLVGRQTWVGFSPGLLDPDTEYYWRVDSVNDHGTTTGDTWTFTSGSNEGDSALLWEPIDWGYSNLSYAGSPFDLVASATFTHTQSGEQITTELFYSGSAATWTLRFSGTRTEEWTFSTTSGDADLNGHTGTVNIHPNPGGLGFVIAGDGGRKWSRLGTTNRAFVPQYVMYRKPHTLYDNPAVIDPDIVTFFDEHGFNGFHTYAFCRWFDLYKDSYDEFSTTNPDPDPRTFEALELLIQKATAAGGMVHIWAWGDEQRQMTPIGFDGGMNGAVDRRLQRYICARLGPLPGWSMGYGFDLQEWVTTTDLATWHVYMQEHLGWDHFLGGRSPDLTQIYDGYAADAWFSSYQQHRPTYDTYVQSIELYHPGKPTFFTDRFRCRTTHPDKDYDLDGIMTRRGMWHSTMAGGAGNIWGYLDPVPPDDVSMEYPNKHQLLTYATFWADRFREDMVRDNAITDAYCLKESNALYVFYKEDASSIQMTLSAMTGPLSAAAVDTKLAYAEIGLGVLDAVDQTWNAPYASDWAIAVGTFVEPDPPSIAPVLPDPDRVFPGNEYTRQLVLLEGSPTPTWSLQAGPGEAQVSGSGFVYGWEPPQEQVGVLVDFAVEAINSEGSDTVSWQVRVASVVDFDNDGDADQVDFGWFQACYSGSAHLYAPGCEAADLSGDGDVDQEDFDAFRACMAGSNQPPGC